MSALPLVRGRFDTAGFAAWLVEQGAEVGIPTNPYEVIRYRAYRIGGKRAETHVVYSKDNGRLTFAGITRQHYEAFLSGDRVPGMFVSKLDGAPNPEPAESRKPSSTAKRRAKLLQRDGDECWFCGLAMGDDVTIEHLVPRSAGGPDKLANYALAHAKCNHAAADKPLIQKIELRAQMRAARQQEQSHEA